MTSEPVIEPAHLREVQAEPVDAEWPPATLLRWNESVSDFLAEVPPARRGAALRQIEREVARWRSQQTSEQIVWAQRRHEVSYRGTIAAAGAIAEHLR